MSNPVRTCVGCRQSSGKANLIRFVLRPDPTLEAEKQSGSPRFVLFADLKGSELGRGAYCHAETRCLGSKAAARQLVRSISKGNERSNVDLKQCELELRRLVEQLEPELKLSPEVKEEIGKVKDKKIRL